MSNIKLSKKLSIFPLSNVIFFPKTTLPLNIFEERYLSLVNDAYYNDKLMGMVQSKKEGESVYQIGCLGKISDLQKSQDGRILINLTGLTRFNILEEIKNDKLYREFKVVKITHLRAARVGPSDTAQVLLAPAVNRQPGFQRKDS